LIGSSRTECTGIYKDLPEESQDPADRAKTLVKSPIPCPQKIVEPKPTTSNPKPFSEDHQPFFFSLFDDNESIVDSDVLSLPREQSDVDGEPR